MKTDRKMPIKAIQGLKRANGYKLISKMPYVDSISLEELPIIEGVHSFFKVIFA